MTPFVLETQNGVVQVSPDSGDAAIGLLVQRGALEVGTLLSVSQAQELGRFLFNGDGLRQTADT